MTAVRRSASRHVSPRRAKADTRALRLRIIETARMMNALGINRGKSGNVSARIDHGFLVTPSALDYEKTRPEDIVAIDNADNTIGRRSPSSEWRFHRDIYAARTDVDAIVHAHAPFATTIACLDRGIPPFHYMIAVAGGGGIRCAPYATFGTQALSDAAVHTTASADDNAKRPPTRRPFARAKKPLTASS